MFNQQYNFTYNSGKRGYSAISKTADTKTVVSYKLIVKRQTTSYTNDVKTSVRRILKLEPRTVLSKTSNAKSNVEAFAAVMYYAKPDLNIFDMYDKRLAILSNEGTDACPFWDAIYREELNKGGTFTFTVPANHEDSKFVVAENKVAFRDKDNNLRLFVIKETEEIDGENGPLIEVYCDPEYIDELNDIVIEDKRPQDRTAEYALGQVLEESRWQVGEVAELGKNTTNFYFMTGIEAINRILDVWGGEIRDRIEVSGNQITGRYIDILTRRGADTGKRWEIDKDIIEIARVTESYPKTALYGRGASLETEDGGYSRKLTFEEVEWSVDDGDPVDKPKGQKWVGDPDALYKYGREKPTEEIETTEGTAPQMFAEQDPFDPETSYMHRFGIYENGNIEDPEELLEATWNELQEQKRPFKNFELDVTLYAEKAGLDHERVRLGDTTVAIDRRFARPIEVEERVIAFEYDVANPDDVGKVEFGQFRDLFSDDERLDKIQAQLDSAQGKANEPIDDDRYPDVKPPTPENFTAEGLFKVIQLKWDFDASSYIASYELYASQTPNFNPTSDRLVWRGKTGGYAFEADTDEQWYFRLRAVNTHGTASDFTEEVSASTIKINAGYDVEPLTITDELIAHDAKIDFAKIANVEITDAEIANVSADKIDAGTIDANIVTVRATKDSQEVRIDNTGLSSVDKNGNTRIHLGIRDISGKGQSDPSTIRFFSGSGSTSAGVGMNVNDHFILGSTDDDVAMELRSEKNILHYAQQHRFVTKKERSSGFNNRYFKLLSRINTDGDENPTLEPDANAWGYIGSTNYHVWAVNAVHINETSMRSQKANIEDLPVSVSYDVLERLKIRQYNYVRKDEDGDIVHIDDYKSYGVVSDEAPDEVLGEGRTTVRLYALLSHTANVVQDQIERISDLEKRIQKLEGEVR